MTDAPFWSENPTLDLAAYRFGAQEAMKRHLDSLAAGNVSEATRHRKRAEWYADRATQLEQQLAAEDETNGEI